MREREPFSKDLSARIPENDYEARLWEKAEGDVTSDARLTTGRHAKRIKNLASGTSADEAAVAFFEATKDTHGGKIKIKKKNSFVGKGGRRIRKS
jgi:hypothetical protein